MQQRAFDNPKISFVWDTAIEEILFDETGVTGLMAKNLKRVKFLKEILMEFSWQLGTHQIQSF